jgi:septum formation topological specificity factor MinE
MMRLGAAAAASGPSAAARPAAPPRRLPLPVVAKKQQPPRAASSSSSSSSASAPALPAVAAAGSQIRYRVKEQQVPPGPFGSGASSKAGANANNARSSSSSTSGAAAGGLDFVTKLKMAWRIFFPERPTVVSPKEEGKQRLRMILVADRCGMSPAGLTDLKKTILRALGEYVDIDSEEQIDVSITMEPGLGTIYCVAVPVARVRPAARVKLAADGTLAGMTVVPAPGGEGSEGEGGGAAEGRPPQQAQQREGGAAAARRSGDDDYNPEDLDSDPSSRFPYGC